MAGWGDEWRNFKPGPRTPATSTVAVPTDRGSRRGAKRCVVTAEDHIIDHAVAKERGIAGDFFQSRKEAVFFIERRVWARAGIIRPLPGKSKWRQVPFDLIVTNPEGLKVVVAKLILDFAFELIERDRPGTLPLSDANYVPHWRPHYQDVKPGGGFREDTYILKKKLFEAQYGVSIEEL